ncbi:upstream-binding factor 1-like protein 1 isoform X2 [Clinocottus analis]|uniref:upstream-binding factor 1-like protein 1 isoform X2 n=1 Tax=Clinocottus analis TaxID=304258 RepID=UPI0035BFB388
MSGSGTEESEEWTRENIQHLLAAMKASNPVETRKHEYKKALKQMDWNVVAFPPFSPEACKEMWKLILDKLRKTRTLTELLVDAEDVFSNSQRETKKRKRKVTPDTKGMPPKPPMSGYSLFCKELDLRKSFGGHSLPVYGQGWRDMTEKQRDDYKTRSTMLKRQYVDELDQFLKNFDKKKRKKILVENRINRPAVSTRLPGEPKMPSRSGCNIFRKKQMFLLREEIPNARERFAMTNKMWQDLSEVEKKRYKEDVFKNNKIYSRQLWEWFKTLPPAKKKHYRKHNPSKIQYLDDGQMEVHDFHEKPRSSVNRPSDSEDEDIDDSDDDDDNNLESDEEEEDDDDVIVFELY